MKIVELGHSGVGKTTYMASMYGAFQNRVEGFSLRAADAADHARLIKLAEDIKNGIYPFTTEQRKEYNFNLEYEGKKALHFWYADYRGKAIFEMKDSEEAKLLQQDISEADSIIIFCDCYALARGNAPTKEIRRITTLMTNILPSLNHPISLAIVLTKVDLVTEFCEAQLAYLSNLITVIEASPLVTGALIPVACGSQPINIEMPLLFGLHIGVSSQVNSLNKLIEEYTNKSKYWEKRSKGLGGMVRHAWNSAWGDVTDKEMARREMEQANEKRKELEPIVQPANALNLYVQKLPLIKSGTSLKQYVKKLSQIKSGIPILHRVLNFIKSLFS